MTMNPYLMGGSSVTSNKPLMVFTGTDPEYSVEDYLNAVTANLPLPYYLQQNEITKNQLSNYSQMPNAAESLQMTMNPYLMGGSSVTSNKPLMVFTGTDPEYSVEDYLNAVTANLILNIGREPINTPLHQNWLYRRTAFIQTTLDGAAQI